MLKYILEVIERESSVLFRHWSRYIRRCGRSETGYPAGIQGHHARGGVETRAHNARSERCARRSRISACGNASSRRPAFARTRFQRRRHPVSTLRRRRQASYGAKRLDHADCPSRRDASRACGRSVQAALCRPYRARAGSVHGSFQAVHPAWCRAHRRCRGFCRHRGRIPRRRSPRCRGRVEMAHCLRQRPPHERTPRCMRP